MPDVEMSKSEKKKKDKKKEKEVESEAPATTTEESSSSSSSSTVEPFISPIAQPLASDKLAKKCLKLVKKASLSKQLRRGVKEVVKAIRKGEKGVMVIAGNITPADVISHIPVLCEENDIPYVYVPSKEELGVAGSTKRPTSCILVQCKDKNTEHKESYDEVQKEVKKIQIAVE